MKTNFIMNLHTILREIRKVRREHGEDVSEPPSIEAVQLARDEACRLTWGRPERIVEDLPE